MQNIYIALGLAICRTATGIGSMIAFGKKNSIVLAIATGFSAGVMLYVSFVEILLKGNEALVSLWRFWKLINVFFFFGYCVVGLIDALIPHAENPHEAHTEFERAPLQYEAPLPTAEDLEMKYTATQTNINSKNFCEWVCLQLCYCNS